MQNCPQCDKEIKAPCSRLVQDACGHQKCRVCLLNDIEICKQCTNTTSSPTESVIKYEGSHQGVISINPDAIKESKDGTVTEITPNRKRTYQILTIPSHITVNKDTPNLYTCKICKKTFKTKTHVKYHQYCAGGKRPFRCGQCSMDFISKCHLDIHVLSHKEEKPFSCEKCGKSFAQKSKLKRHGLLHTNSKPCVCSLCGKSFRTKDKLKLHQLVHSKEKPYGCKQCKAKFNNSSNLKKHLAVHLKEGVHMCDQCGRRFKLKASLVMHHKVHDNIRSYKCRNCPKAFFNLKDLHRHSLVHSDDKLYDCAECKTSFRRKDNLYRHIRNTHPGKNPAITQKTVRSTVKPSIVDTPNAIKVITSSVELTKKTKEQNQIPVMNVPIKLAFKTSAFKNNYNIQRNIEPEDNVNIYEKILLPNNIHNNAIDAVKQTALIDKDDLLPPIHYGTSFDQKSHAVIKNIKFKLPEKYVNLSSSDKLLPLQPVNNANVNFDDENKVYTELRPANENCASVIVNAGNNDVHWRKRTSQCFNSSQKRE